MIAHAALTSASSSARTTAVLVLAREPETAWEAKGFGDLVPPATLAEARAHRDDLARLLGREREAAADFLLALADFDRRHGWERLGHASLFAFLTRELGLSNSAAWYRQSAARLLPRFPSVERALREGQLCLSVVGELARVLTPENEVEVLPRFLGTSSREAKEVVAAILPCPDPPRRDVIRVVGDRAREAVEAGLLAGHELVATAPARLTAGSAPRGGATTVSNFGAAPPAEPAPRRTDSPLLAPEAPPTHPARGVRDAVVPLTAELRRLSVTVSARFLRKLDAARDGLSHAIPGATAEQVLEAALDRLLEHQARRRGQLKRPRRSGPRTSPPAPAAEPPAVATPASAPDPRSIPAAVRREVWARDEGRCQHPLDAGGICGSTVRVEIDHVQPVALGGGTPAAGELRLACRVHNLEAAREALGGVVMSAARRKGRRG
jgi:hypothetical protein